MSLGRAIVCLLVSLAALRAGAEPRVLRLATAAPDGTAWARELKAAGDGVEAASHGELRLKWYFGGIAGDEMAVTERMGKGQLDGVASGGPLCERLMPSMRVLALPGLFRSREEAAYVIQSLRPLLVDEMERAGYTLLITSGLGPTVIFSRQPIRTFSELRAAPLWTWDLNPVEPAAERAMGLNVAPAGLLAAGPAYSSRRVDGFIAVPEAALAFQWSTQAHYITDLRTRYLTSCVVLSNRAFDRLPIEQQNIVRDELAKSDARFEELGRHMDDELLGTLFARQGLVPVPVTPSFRSQFLDEARQARRRLGNLVPPSLIARVERMLADYRAGHEPARAR